MEVKLKKKIHNSVTIPTQTSENWIITGSKSKDTCNRNEAYQKDSWQTKWNRLRNAEIKKNVNHDKNKKATNELIRLCGKNILNPTGKKILEVEKSTKSRKKRTRMMWVN